MPAESRSVRVRFTQGLYGPNVSASVLAAPAVIRSLGHILATGDYGACGNGDPDEDTAALTLATIAASADGRPVISRGLTIPKLIIRPGNSSYGNRWNQDGKPIYIGVPLLSNVTYDFRGTTIYAARRRLNGVDVTATATELQWLFGTTPNELDRETYENIVFWGGTWDLGAEYVTGGYSKLARFGYAVGVTGCTGFRREECEFVNSTDYTGAPSNASRGRALHIDNCYDVKLLNDRMTGIGQGLYSHYIDNVTVRGARLDDMVEGLDFDGPSHDVTINDVKMKNFRNEGDGLDFGGGKRWSVSDVYGEDIGTIFKVYIKSYERLTWADFLTAAGAGCTQSEIAQIHTTEDITVKGIHGLRCGIITSDDDDTEGEIITHGAMFIGGLRNALTWSGPTAGSWDNTNLEGFTGPRRVRVEDVTLIDSAAFSVNDCEDFQGRGFTLVGSRSLDSSTDLFRNAAFVARQSQAGGSAAGIETDRVTRMTGFASDITVVNAEGSALAITGAKDFAVTNLKVNGFNTLNSANSRAAVPIMRLGAKPGAVRLTNVTIKGGNSSSDSLFKFAGVSAYSAWATATSYAVNDKVLTGGLKYICLVAHTSGTFATDLAAGKWDLWEYRVELLGRVRLEPQNGALIAVTQDSVGQNVFPTMKTTITGGYNTTSATNSAVFDYQGRDKVVVLGWQVVPAVGGSGNATNYTRIKLYKVSGGISTEITALGYVDMDAAAYVAGTAYKGNGTTVNDGSSVFNEGDQFQITYQKQGTGSTFAGPLIVNLFVINYMTLGGTL